MKNYFKFLKEIQDSGGFGAIVFASVFPVVIGLCLTLTAAIRYDEMMLLLLPLYMAVTGTVFVLLTYLELESGEDITIKFILECIFLYGWLLFPMMAGITIWYIITRGTSTICNTIVVRKK